MEKVSLYGNVVYLLSSITVFLIIYNPKYKSLIMEK